MSVFGIDISSHQKGLKLQNVLKDGVKFAILRAGFTGWGTGVNLNKDDEFETFYAEAKKIGLPVGAYWYSCANTYTKGKEEAKYMYEHCLKGKQFEYPIYIDVEDEHWQKQNKTLTTEAIKGFCEYLEALGYYVGIYANVDWFRNKIKTDELEAYDKWVAYWTKNRPTYPKGGMWQFGGGTNLIRSPKMAGRTIDQDFAYKDYPTIIKNAKLNGYGTQRKSVDELAQEVINGEWGNKPVRKKRLTEAGYDYDAVQDRVNEILHSQK